MAGEMDFCEMLWRRYREVAEQHGRNVPRGEEAAWGGYLATLFRNADGKVVPHAQVRARFNYFPSARVYRAFTSLGRADSITVDPHKLGYLPYGAGGFVGRDRRMTQFVGQHPVYIYDKADAQPASGRLGQLGDYILEGSKAGAAAAAAYVTHSVLPLDAEHFGRVCGHTIRATEYLFESLHALAHLLAIMRLNMMHNQHFNRQHSRAADKLQAFADPARMA